MFHSDLEKLTQLARAVVAGTGRAWESAFEPIGLLLWSTPARASYDAVPANAVAFAGTGGDGVTFSFVTRSGDALEAAPVLMSVPMNFGHESAILGADLRDFLAIGMRLGFFFLEQVTYDRPSFLRAYAEGSDRYELDDAAKAILGRIGAAFDVEAPRDLGAHLDDLDRRYRSWLEPGIPNTTKLDPKAAGFMEELLRAVKRSPTT